MRMRMRIRNTGGDSVMSVMFVMTGVFKNYCSKDDLIDVHDKRVICFGVGFWSVTNLMILPSVVSVITNVYD
jgi:hypothetical protein